MRVYRYENERGLGPYWTQGVLDMWLAHNESALEPDSEQPRPPENLRDRARLWSEVFGCPSPQALTRWFRGWEFDLEKAGFAVAVYEVPEALVRLSADGKQCVFPRKQARRLL